MTTTHRNNLYRLASDAIAMRDAIDEMRQAIDNSIEINGDAQSPRQIMRAAAEIFKMSQQLRDRADLMLDVAIDAAIDAA
jgi:uncharacterized protein (UPF0147 family)